MKPYYEDGRLTKIRCVFCQFLTTWVRTELLPKSCPGCSRLGGFTEEPA